MPAQKIRFARSHDGVRLAYASSGAGPTVVKAATWLSHLEYDWESPVWRHLLARAVAQLPLRALRRARLRPVGLGGARTCRSTAGCATWRPIVDALGVRALRPARHLAGRVDRDRLCGAPPRARHAPGAARRLRARPPRAQPIRNSSAKRPRRWPGWPNWAGARPTRRSASSSPRQFIPGGTPEQHQWFNELERLSTARRPTRRASCASSTRIDVTALLPQVRCPTLVLHSRNDVRVPIAEGRLMASAIPGAQFVPIDSGNHLLLEDEPGWPHWVDGGARVPAAAGSRRATRLRRADGARSANCSTCWRRDATTRRSRRRSSLSEKTVRNQTSALFAKLGVENRAQAIVRAREAASGRLG